MLSVRRVLRGTPSVVVGLALSTSAVQALAQGYLPANTLTTLNLCEPNFANNSDLHYFHFYTGGSGWTWSIGGITTTPGDLPDLPAGETCQPISINSSGVPANNTNDAVFFSSCSRSPQACGGMSMGWYIFKAPVTPSLSISQSNIPISATPTTTSEVISLNPPFATLAVSGACTTQNGGAATVSPSTTGSNISSYFGQATFSIVTQINTPVPGQSPSGTCTFSVPGGSNTVTASFQGAVFQPSVSVSPSSISNAGTRDVVATIFPAFAGVILDGTCTTSGGATVSIPANAPTNGQGQAIFSISASNLIGFDPNPNVVPSASCTIKVHGGTGQANVSFTTGNACAFALQPMPAQCGNPN